LRIWAASATDDPPNFETYGRSIAGSAVVEGEGNASIPFVPG